MPGAPDISTSALGPPQFLLIEITSRCNLKCRMCPLTAGETPSSRQPGHMADAVWRAVVPFARETGRVNIGGYGEPLSNPKCFDYLRELDAAGVRVDLTTNGTMVTREFAEQLKSLAHFQGVNVSIDSPDPAVYHRIRGGSLAKTLEGVKNLTAVLEPSQVTVSSVMMRSTVDTLPAFPALLAKLKVAKHVVQGLTDYTSSVNEEALRWQDGLPGHVARLTRAAEQAGVAIEFALPERVAAELRDQDNAAGAIAAGRTTPHPADDGAKVCFAPWDAPVIDKDGRVFPCCYSLSHAAAVLGDLNESSAQEIWLGDRFQQFRRDIVDARTTPAACRGCTVVPTGRHVLSLYAARILDRQCRLNGPHHIRLAVQNTGTATWTPDDHILIGTASPRDGASTYYHPSWIGLNRITSFAEAAVPPGGTATFSFEITTSDQRPIETFQLVVEHKCWLPETRFRLRPGRAGWELASTARRLRQALKRFGMRRRLG